jgi:hypothetical protein
MNTDKRIVGWRSGDENEKSIHFIQSSSMKPDVLRFCDFQLRRFGQVGLAGVKGEEGF